MLNQAPRTDEPLGLYIHIPFCRKRCKFCYFKVYTDKNAPEIETYLDALIKENELYSRTRAFQGRQLRFAYFGGGTPSYISEKQLRLPGRGTESSCELGERRRGYLRMRAGHAEKIKAGNTERNRRHPAEPRHRALQRRHSGSQWPRASLAGNLPGLRVGARSRFSSDQHRSDRRDDGRVGRELARLRPARHRTGAGFGDHLSDGAALQHGHFARDDQEGSRLADRRLARRSGAGSIMRSSNSGARLPRSPAPTRWPRPRSPAGSSTPTRSGTAAT